MYLRSQWCGPRGCGPGSQPQDLCPVLLPKNRGRNSLIPSSRPHHMDTWKHQTPFLEEQLRVCLQAGLVPCMWQWVLPSPSFGCAHVDAACRTVACRAHSWPQRPKTAQLLGHCSSRRFGVIISKRCIRLVWHPCHFTYLFYQIIQQEGSGENKGGQDSGNKLLCLPFYPFCCFYLTEESLFL